MKSYRATKIMRYFLLLVTTSILIVLLTSCPGITPGPYTPGLTEENKKKKKIIDAISGYRIITQFTMDGIDAMDTIKKYFLTDAFHFSNYDENIIFESDPNVINGGITVYYDKMLQDSLRIRSEGPGKTGNGAYMLSKSSMDDSLILNMAISKRIYKSKIDTSFIVLTVSPSFTPYKIQNDDFIISGLTINKKLCTITFSK